MEKLHIEATEFSPLIHLDPFSDTLEIRGESRPENARKFFQPVLEWLDNYSKVLYYMKSDKGDAYSKDLLFTFAFDYLNSTSLKFVYDILKKIESLSANATSVTILWLYEAGDEDMKENGEELAKLVKLKFRIEEGQ
ncbi:MAG: DUF1987 domain-containing protein [Bacteroidia bacterium]|nr:DUF1987 domain-containing protein [Bacteroidia bacterium]